MIDLIGTIEDIAAAGLIRDKVAANLLEIEARPLGSLERKLGQEAIREYVLAVSDLVAEILSEPSAAWWVAGRGCMPHPRGRGRQSDSLANRGQAFDYLDWQIEIRGLAPTYLAERIAMETSDRAEQDALESRLRRYSQEVGELLVVSAETLIEDRHLQYAYLIDDGTYKVRFTFGGACDSVDPVSGRQVPIRPFGIERRATEVLDSRRRIALPPHLFVLWQ